MTFTLLWFARWVKGCRSHSGVPGCLFGRCRCRRVTARYLEWGRLCIHTAANAVADVVKRCLSFKSTILSPCDSSGVASGSPRSVGSAFQHSEIDVECVSALGNAFQHSEMGVKMENFENFYFLFFQFPRSILHQHLCPRPLYCARAGSRVVFYISHIVTPSGTGFKQKSVNGLPIKTSTSFGSFHIHFPEQKLGRPCATLIFGRVNPRGNSHEVKRVSEINNFRASARFSECWNAPLIDFRVLEGTFPSAETLKNTPKPSETESRHLGECRGSVHSRFKPMRMRCAPYLRLF